MRMFSEWSPARCLLFGGVFAAASGLAFAQDVGADDAPADPPEVAEPAGGDVDADAGDGEGADQTERDTGGELAVPPWRRPGSPFSRREDGAGQQATAMELSRELAPLLGPDGLPRTLGDAQGRADLRGVATRCDLLLRSLTDPSALQRLYETQARVHNALVQDAAAHGEAVEVARGLGKLREAAARLADLEDDAEEVSKNDDDADDFRDEIDWENDLSPTVPPVRRSETLTKSERPVRAERGALDRIAKAQDKRDRALARRDAGRSGRTLS